MSVDLNNGDAIEAVDDGDSIRIDVWYDDESRWIVLHASTEKVIEFIYELMEAGKIRPVLATRGITSKDFESEEAK